MTSNGVSRGQSPVAVQTHSSKLKVLANIFEVRYLDGFRLLDRTGELVVRMKRDFPSWTIKLLSMQLCAFMEPRKHFLLNVGPEKLDLSITERLAFSDIEKQIPDFGKEAERLYELVAACLELPKTIRVGYRIAFLAPADSLEESDRFVCKTLGTNDLLESLLEKTKSELRDISFSCLLDDTENPTKVVRRVNLSSAVVEQEPGAVPYLGFQDDEGSGGIVIDIDSYSRPDTGHFEKSSNFAQESFNSSFKMASHIFEWMVAHRR